MWSGEEEVNENGETVQLYAPTKGPPRRNNTDTAESHIGGKAYQRKGPLCAVCKASMPLLAQIRVPNVVTADGSRVDRILFVFGCPKATCFAKVEFAEGFAGDDKGVMSCQTVETPVVAPEKPVAPTRSSWYADDDDEVDDHDDDNDWGVSSNDGALEMEKLEEAMAAMEKKLKDGVPLKESIKKTTKPKDRTPSKASGENGYGGPSFPCHLLTKQIEPPAPNPIMEEDDVGLYANDDKIRNMLARYMAEEEDENILAAIKGTDLGGGIGEEDERLTEEERLLFGFQDRLRRVPRQVIRYAKGGRPLWSIPSTRKEVPLWNHPVCSACGTKCIFEMQLLPSLLHLLQVDQFESSGTANETGAKINEMLSKGMNWGSAAVFTCPNQSCDSINGALVIQASVDETPYFDSGDREFGPTMAVVEDMDDDGEFEPYKD